MNTPSFAAPVGLSLIAAIIIVIFAVTVKQFIGSIAEFNNRRECVGFATGCIGKDGLKPDTAYIAKGGKLVEAGDQ